MNNVHIKIKKNDRIEIFNGPYHITLNTFIIVWF